MTQTNPDIWGRTPGGMARSEPAGGENEGERKKATHFLFVISLQQTTMDMSLSEDDDSNDDEEEKEIFESLLLRYRLKNHSFPWRAFRAAGWEYQQSSYLAPNGRRFPSSNDIIERFDRFAVPDVFSNLQSFESTGSSDDNEDDREVERLRRDFLKELHHLTVDSEFAERDSRVDDDDTSTVESEGEQLPALRRSNRKREAKSATVAEKGSDLYLNKKTKGSRKTNKSNTPHPQSISAEDLTFPSLQECLEFVEKLSVKEVGEIEATYERHFDDWRFLLSTNHSLLLFGAGSKFNVINSFCENELDKEGYTLIINGFDKDVSVDAILDLLVQLFLQNKEPEPTSAIPLQDGDFCVAGISNPWRAHALVERAIAVSRALARRASETLVPIFLAIHSLDGIRRPIEQEALSALLVNSKVSNGTASIRLVASVDHLDSPTLWDLPVSTNFSWIWKEVHTYRPYQRELVLLSDSELRKKSPKAASRGEEEQNARVMEVLKNVAPRHAEVVQILAQLQLNRLKTKWVDYADFRDECKRRYVVNKESQLQPFLAELEDHRLIVSDTVDGRECVCIPYNNEKLHEILAYKRDEGD